MNHDCIRARAGKYLDGDGDGSDNIWNEGSDFVHRFPLEREVIVVDSKLAHQEEGRAEEFLALWMQDAYHLSSHQALTWLMKVMIATDAHENCNCNLEVCGTM